MTQAELIKAVKGHLFDCRAIITDYLIALPETEADEYEVWETIYQSIGDTELLLIETEVDSQ